MSSFLYEMIHKENDARPYVRASIFVWKKTGTENFLIDSGSSISYLSAVKSDQIKITKSQKEDVYERYIWGKSVKGFDMLCDVVFYNPHSKKEERIALQFFCVICDLHIPCILGVNFLQKLKFIKLEWWNPSKVELHFHS